MLQEPHLVELKPQNAASIIITLKLQTPGNENSRGCLNLIQMIKIHEEHGVHVLF